MEHPRIQVAGVKSLTEALMLSFSGVDHLGFPLGRGIVEGDLDEPEAASISRKLPPCTVPVLITYLDTADEVLELAKTVQMTRIQLHGDISVEQIAKLRKVKGLYLMKSVVIGKHSPDQVVYEYDRYVDAFITDTHDPIRNRSGATGMVHDWKDSARVVRMTKKPVILAGGLKAENVADAITTVRPAGVDAHTGLEDANGAKNELLVQDFVKNAKRAFAAL